MMETEKEKAVPIGSLKSSQMKNANTGQRLHRTGIDGGQVSFGHSFAKVLVPFAFVQQPNVLMGFTRLESWPRSWRRNNRKTWPVNYDRSSESKSIKWRAQIKG